MSFAIVTDSTANLTKKLTDSLDVKVISFSYFIDGDEYQCSSLEQFDDESYYSAIRKGTRVTTSQVNPQGYIDIFEPLIKEGNDVVFVGLSSGISGSFQSATIAKAQLEQEYPQRKIHLIDSLGAGLGEGLLVLRAVKCRTKGMTAQQTVETVTKMRDRLYQVFTVDDLMHLKRTGRLSNLSAAVGTVLNIKPLLKGSDEGKIVAFQKIRGRKQAVEAMAQKYATLAVEPQKQTVGITYAHCREEAEELSKMIMSICPPKEILLLKHEAVTGSHIGPGAIALFFEGDKDVRQK